MILPLLRHLSIPVIYGITNPYGSKKYTKINAKKELRKENMKYGRYIHKTGPGGKTVNRITHLSNLPSPPAGSGVSMDLVDLETVGAMTVTTITQYKSPLGRILNAIDGLDLEKITANAAGFDWNSGGASLPNVLWRLADRTERLLGWIISPDAVRGKIEFNQFAVRKYDPAQFPEGRPYAMAPHRDPERYINVTAVWLLRGKSGLYVCKDKLGRDKKKIIANPGQLILLRGAGYAGIPQCPFHFISRSDEELVTFTMRQRLF